MALEKDNVTGHVDQALGFCSVV